MSIRNVIRAAILFGGCILIYFGYSQYRELKLEPIRQKAVRPVALLSRVFSQSYTDQELADWISICTANPFRRDRGHDNYGETLYRKHLWDLDDAIRDLQQSKSLEHLLGPNSQLATRLGDFQQWVASEKMQRDFYDCTNEQTPHKLRRLQQVEGTYTLCLDELWQAGRYGAPTTVSRPSLEQCHQQLEALPSLSEAMQPASKDDKANTRDYSISLGTMRSGDSLVELTLDNRGARADVIVSPDGARAAFVIQRGDKHLVIVDGEEGPPYENIMSAPVFSTDSTRVAYHARKGGASVLVVNGVEGPPYRNVLSFRFSPTGARIAYLAYGDGRWHTIVDGQEQPSYGPANQAGVVFSPNATRFAYVNGDRPQFVVVDGRKGPPYDAILQPGPLFSPDSAHVAYAARRNGQTLVVVDEKEWPAFDGLMVPGIIFSPDSNRIAFIAKQGAKQVVVLDGRPGVPFDEVGYLIFSPDSRRFAHWGLRNWEHFVVVDGRESEAYAVVIEPGPVFSPDSQHVGYSATRAGKARVVIDGKDGPTYDSIAAGSPVFSPDSARIAYVSAANHKALAVVDGRESPTFDRITGNVAFSPDSKRTVFTAMRDKQWHVVIDTAEGAAYDQIVSPSARFSFDSTHVAFVVKRGQQRSVVMDGTEQSPYFALDENSLTYSPDSAHVAYTAWKGGWRLVVDGRATTIPVGQFIKDTLPVFDSPERVRALGRTLPDGEMVRLVTLIKSEHPTGARVSPEGE